MKTFCAYKKDDSGLITYIGNVGNFENAEDCAKDVSGYNRAISESCGMPDDLIAEFPVGVAEEMLGWPHNIVLWFGDVGVAPLTEKNN